MNFSRDFLKEMMTTICQICEKRKISLMIHFDKVMSVSCDNTPDTDTYDVLLEFKRMLNNLNTVISNCNNINIDLNNDEKTDDELSATIEDLIPQVLENVKQCDVFVDNILASIVTTTLDTSTEISDEHSTSSEIIENVDTIDEGVHIYDDNDTLIISEKEGKVFLPYKLVSLKEELEKNSRYDNLQDLIDKKYTIPIEYYRNSVLSRFKETYSLMKHKEKKNIFQSIELGLDLAFNYELNPAIISACKNLDELDIYLDCLEENELDKFDLFKIKYEILPK